MEELKRDFKDRCAYSMQHEVHAGQLEVDHFDPNQKKDKVQDYNNLFLASKHCNLKKLNWQPKKSEKEVGCRYLNPCREMDYGEQIFADPSSHELIGVTAAAKWHIRFCGLNATHLVRERANRAHFQNLILDVPIRIRFSIDAAAKAIEAFQSVVEFMIPEIPAPRT